MTTFLTIEFPGAYPPSLQRARHLNDDERARVLPEYRDSTFISVGDHVELPEIVWADMPNRAPDGDFRGCSSRAYIITQNEYDAYIKLNAERQAARKAHELDQTRAMYQAIIDRAKQQGGAMTPEAARKARKRWIDTYNEGGEGFVPSYITTDQLQAAEAWLAAHA